MKAVVIEWVEGSKEITVDIGEWLEEVGGAVSQVEDVLWDWFDETGEIDIRFDGVENIKVKVEGRELSREEVIALAGFIKGRLGLEISMVNIVSKDGNFESYEF